ncbi:ATP-binding protein [Streptomyces mirabilis]|uniref:ATP-binding protein n=1 Tax=Streptomyces mirabilis TaxID=68239 RepID=UPI0036D842DB
MRSRWLQAEDGTPVATCVFTREPASVPQVRRFVTDAVTDWKMPDLADTAELVASELASNAVRHARADVFRVTLRRLSDDRVRVAVIDRSRTLPKRESADDEADHGRGLAIVEAVSQQWDTEPLPWGKRVWADLQTPPLPKMPANEVPIYTSCRAQVVYVLIVVAVACLILAGAAAQR